MVEKINNYIDNLPLNIEPDGLYAPIRYALSVGGKRLRPVLMMQALNCGKKMVRMFCSRLSPLRCIIISHSFMMM